MAKRAKPDELLTGIERRFVGGREVRATSRDGKPVIEGYGAVFDEESSDLGGFVEIIEPGFFDDVLDNDVRGLWNHNDDIPLGRSSNNTLDIAQDSTGLQYVIYINEDDSEALSKYQKVKRGDVSQSSFAFFVKRKDLGDDIDGDEWKVAGDKIVRVLKKGGCRELFDVSPVTYPAYQQASAQARSRAELLRRDLNPSDSTDPDAQAGGGEGELDHDQVQALLEPYANRTEITRRKYNLNKE